MIRGLLCAAVLGVFALPAPGAPPRELPEFPHQRPDDWINAAPITASSLLGHPLLIEFWTFDCSNCLASQAWMREVAARYRSEGLAVLGVHTPELPHEHDPQAVRAAVRRLGIDYPVMLDGDYAFWGMLGNRYWPSFYLFDAQGRLVATQVGELHRGEARSDAFERLLVETVQPHAPTKTAQ